jgi:phospholipid/cholesterol/gamma-HCH transport system permease protein
MYDEPFAGLDPISLGTAAQLIRRLNDTLGITSIVVSHDLEETFRIADQVIVLANGRIAAQGTPTKCALDRPAGAPVRARAADGPVHFHYPGPRRRGLQRGLAMSWCNPADVGFAPRASWRDSATARACSCACRAVGADAARARLVRDQVHFLGNYLAGHHRRVGPVRRLRAGAAGLLHAAALRLAEALGLLVALSLVRELGPVVTALLFAGRAGTSLTAEIGLMKAGEQLSAHGDDGGRPGAAHPGAALLGRRDRHAAAGGGVQRGRHHRRLVVGVLLIGVDPGAFWSQMQGGVDVFKDVGNGVIKSLVFGVAVTFIAVLQGYEASPRPKASRARPRARGDGLAGRARRSISC